MIDRQGTILVTGASGMIGGEVLKLLKSRGFKRILAPSHAKLELSDQGDDDMSRLISTDDIAMKTSINILAVPEQ